MFQKLTLIPSSGEGMKPNLLGPLHEVDLNLHANPKIEIGFIKWTHTLGCMLSSDDGCRVSFRNFACF
jgi:hypothetical protein